MRIYPEGNNKRIKLCKNIRELKKNIKKHKKVQGIILSYRPRNKVFSVKLTKNGTIGELSCPNSYSSKSLVGHTIECFVVFDGNIIKCIRDISYAQKWCLKNYKIGQKVLGKVISYTSYGGFVDIGGGYSAMLFYKEVSGVKHISEKYKLGCNYNFVITSIDKENGLTQIGVLSH